MDETDQIRLPAEPDQSAEAQRTRVWRLDQFVSLGKVPEREKQEVLAAIVARKDEVVSS